jgi:membrane-associated protease RseP (regulator of RpoE activity)
MATKGTLYAPAVYHCLATSDTLFSSVATVDYDYSKAYGGAGDTSVISSSGGTFGDNTQPTAGEVAASTLAARQALGASFDSEAQFREEVREEVLVIDAPPGKLGVVIDTPDDGAPVVHAVKDSSVIAHMIQVGDKLVAVDETDVRSMTAIKVSKLISRKSANPSRKLTVVRTSLLGHP